MDGIMKAFLPRSSSAASSSGKPKLDRKNAIKNPNFVAPDTEGEDDDLFKFSGDDSSRENLDYLLRLLNIRDKSELGISEDEWKKKPPPGPLVYRGNPEQEPPQPITTRSKTMESSSSMPEVLLEEPPARRNGGAHSIFSPPSVSRPAVIENQLRSSMSAPSTVISRTWPNSEEGSFTGSHSSQSMGSSSSSSATASGQDDDDEPLLSTVSWESWIKLEKLGSGSFGMVYKGVNCRGEFFAVKEISISNHGVPDSQVNEQLVQLQQEIKFLQDCQHENIVQYLGTERTQTELYIFLELATEGSLVSLYRRFPLYEAQIRNYTRQILQGLKYLHDRNCVHRDLKCANILVKPNGKIKLADFGMAKQLGMIDTMRSCKGTAYWMAPEVMNPKKTAGLPSDIWSLGCTILEMASGEPPFSGLPWTSVFWKVGHDGEIPAIPDDLPADTKDFILQCLRPDPAMRPTAAMLLRHPLVNLEAQTQAEVNPGRRLSTTMRADSLENRSQARSVRTRPSMLRSSDVGV